MDLTEEMRHALTGGQPAEFTDPETHEVVISGAETLSGTSIPWVRVSTRAAILSTSPPMVHSNGAT